MKLPDIPILRSLGAKGVNYDIMDLVTGEKFWLAEGTKITDVEVFAGKGVHSMASLISSLRGGWTNEG